MSEWIDQETRTWREDAVREALHPIDAASVLRISIPLQLRPDVLRWPTSRDGKVSVRVAYHTIIHSRSADITGVDASTGTETSILWPAIWKARVWPKVQSFMWQLGYNAIVAKANLVRRGVPLSPLCQLCNRVESREHIFLDCWCVRHVWFHLLGLHVAGVQNVQMDQWLCSYIPRRHAQSWVSHSSGQQQTTAAPSTRASQEQKWSTVMLGCWFIWKARCQLVFENKLPNQSIVMHQVQRARAGDRDCTGPAKLGDEPGQTETVGSSGNRDHEDQL